MSIHRGDEVIVTAGKDKGKRGQVTRVFPEENRVIVDGVNLVKRHLRRQPGSLQAGIIDKPAPLSRSNVMLVCPNCDKPSRIGRAVLQDGTHVRVCKNCGEVIDRER
ncbi:MAG: 50S ribosomal protein L24 [Chloroflexi bacterium]|nr:50S ribosomal protein L24 [Chloroflexota bacterium]